MQNEIVLIELFEVYLGRHEGWKRGILVQEKTQALKSKPQKVFEEAKYSSPKWFFL